MNRTMLRWFFLAVQFVMLAVSIPKVAQLFHAYDTDTMGPLVGGVDIRSWCVGFAIDLTATVVTWAALQKYEATGKRTSLIAPGVIIAVCSSLSVIANYEDAATLTPTQYAHVTLFEQSALLINPLLISAPPVIVLLLIMIVPSVLAQPRIKTADEIAAETAQEEALILANARLKEVRVRANAKVRDARMSGLVDTARAVAERAGIAQSAHVDAPEEQLADDGEPTQPLPTGRTLELDDSAVLPVPSARVSRAMWNSMTLKERVLKSGLISATEIADVLAVSGAHARKLLKEVRATDGEPRVITGRTGASYQALIDALYERKTRDSFAQAQKLERALGLRRRSTNVRALQVVPDEPTADDDAAEA